MKITNFKKINHEKVKASFDIEFAIGTIFNFSFICLPNGKKFVAMPSTPYKKDNETKYKVYYYPPKGKEEDFQKKVLNLLEPFIKQNPHTEEEELPF